MRDYIFIKKCIRSFIEVRILCLIMSLIVFIVVYVLRYTTVWVGTVFDIETVLTLNWIVWNRTDYLNKNGYGIKYPTEVDMP